MLNIEFKYNIDFPSHKDVHIHYPELNTNRWVDSYYLVLDKHLLPNIETFAKAKLVQKKAIENWQEMLNKIKEGESVILPYDLSDEYIGVFYIIYSEERLKIADGWTQEYEGHSIRQSTDKNLPFNFSRLRLDSLTHEVSKKELIDTLEAIKNKL
jgi:hypothetical protein